MKHPHIPSAKMTVLAACLSSLAITGFASSEETNCPCDPSTMKIFDPGMLKPVDSTLRVKVGQEAPDFELPSVDGKPVRLSHFRGKKAVVLSFVPAAWTPVCSGQWPGYNIARPHFEKNDAVLLGITVDNIPTLAIWAKEIGPFWFSVLSDFWPHGSMAKQYGVLRSDGTTERALFVIDKSGVIRYIDVHDINKRPPMDALVQELEKLRRRN